MQTQRVTRAIATGISVFAGSYGPSAIAWNLGWHEAHLASVLRAQVALLTGVRGPLTPLNSASTECSPEQDR